MDTGFQLVPPSASTLSHPVNDLFWYLMAWSFFFTFAVAALVATFAIVYRARPGHRQKFVGTHHGLEWFWTIATFLIFLTFFFWGANLFIKQSGAPANAMEIHVIGKQWMWKIQHPEGRREINELHVPVGVPVKLVMASQDVIHAFFVPAFRVKQDVMPGRYSTEWFEADRIGEYSLFCSQYCGTEHSKMRGRVVVMSAPDYQRWLAGKPVGEVSDVQSGADLFVKYSCVTCHGQNAPTLAGLYQSRVPLSDGTTVTADENYLRESILYPSAKIVAGYPPIMPGYNNQLNEEQVFQLVAYIKSLQNAAATRPDTAPPAVIDPPPATMPNRHSDDPSPHPN